MYRIREKRESVLLRVIRTPQSGDEDRGLKVRNGFPKNSVLRLSLYHCVPLAKRWKMASDFLGSYFHFTDGQ